MNLTDITANLLSLVLVLAFLVLLIVFTMLARKRSPARREIPGYARLKRAIGLAVETGSRMHISLGRGGLTGLEGASALTGLTLLDRITRLASASDKPPVASTGDGSLSILTQDVIKGAFQSASAEVQYKPSAGRLTGLTPLSYAAGAMAVVHDEQVSANLMVGHFGSEVGLITGAADQGASLALGGSEDLSGQAVLYAAAQEPLVGEEIFAGGAYLDAGPAHAASLQVQDLFRWLIILAIILGAVARMVGIL